MRVDHVRALHASVPKHLARVRRSVRRPLTSIQALRPITWGQLSGDAQAKTGKDNR
jgi:hypothetical protein